MCGGSGEGEAGFKIALGGLDVKVGLALGRAAGIQRTAGFRVLVEGRAWVGGVHSPFILGQLC